MSSRSPFDRARAARTGGPSASGAGVGRADPTRAVDPSCPACDPVGMSRTIPKAAGEPAGFPSVDVGTPVAPQPLSRPGRQMLGLSLMLIALNLRALFSSLSALLPEVMAGTGAGAGARQPDDHPAGPVPRRPSPSRRLRRPAGSAPSGPCSWRSSPSRPAPALRGFATVPALLGGGVLAGAGIAFGNVLLPGLVKRDFPDRIAAMTGLYSMSLSGGAAIAAALTVPVARAASSWATGLAVWALPAAAAALLWLPPRRPARRLRGRRPRAGPPPAVAERPRLAGEPVHGGCSRPSPIASSAGSPRSCGTGASMRRRPGSCCRCRSSGR